MGKERVKLIQLRLKNIIEGISGAKIFALTGSQEKLINEILDSAGDEFGREELIQLAKEKDYQLRIRLIRIKHEILNQRT